MCGFGGEINCMVKAQSNIPKAEVYLRYLSTPQSWAEIDPTEHMCFTMNQVETGLSCHFLWQIQMLKFDLNFI